MQNGLLREQDLLRCLEEKHDTGFAAPFQKRGDKSATDNRIRFRSANRFDRCRSFSPAAVRRYRGARAFAASSRGDLYSSDLIQRA